MTPPRNQLSALALDSFEIVRLSLRVARSSVRLAFLRLLIALVRAGLFLAQPKNPSNTPPSPCTPGK